MGDLGVDTAVTNVGDGRYTAVLSREWEIWGPMGGYVAAVALRAAGAESQFERPASFFCHYLTVGRFEEVQIEVTKLRSGRTAESLRVLVRQGDRDVMDATVSTIADVPGVEHEITEPPDVPGPEGLKNMAELMAEVDPEGGPPFPFWRNFEPRPTAWKHEWPPDGPEPPVWQQWERFEPMPDVSDPWIDWARVVLLVDLPSWPSGSMPHAYKWRNGPEWMAPSLDLYVAFHQSPKGDPWLLIDGHSPIATDGMLGWNARLWSSDRRLLASGGGQALCRRVPPQPA